MFKTHIGHIFPCKLRYIGLTTVWGTITLCMKGTLLLSLLAFLIIPTHTWGQNTDFTADSLSGCSPVVVRFLDQSANATAWDWDFGNGSTSNLQNPATTYIQPGQYTVTLTATFSNGSTETTTKSNYISIFGSPTADFEALRPTICLGQPAQFRDRSQQGSGLISDWLWDFGTGVISTDQNPDFDYQIPNNYTITLSVTDVNGCKDVIVKSQYLSVNTIPDANFTADNTLGCTAPLTVNFNHVGTPGLNHIWDFGNGDSSFVENPVYTYRTSGTFTVTHIVFDDGGCQDVLTRTNLVSVGDSDIDIQASDTVVCLGEQVVFLCGITNPTSMFWDFGDGNTTSACNTANTYMAAGTYTVTINATNQDGCSFTGQKDIVVFPAPDANFIADRTQICSTIDDPRVVFTNTSNNPGPVSYLWEISDGTIDSTVNLTHNFKDNPPEFQPYLYNVKLTVTNDGGCTAVEEKTNYIVAGNTGAAINADIRSGCAPLVVNFRDSSYSVSTINSWLWDFGDGNTSTLQNPMHTYADTGKYDVTLTVETIDGCQSTIVYPDYIDMGEPISNDFDATPTTACARELIQFTLSNTSVDSVFWIFGDGRNSRVFEPEHAYADTGSIDVSLVTYNRGCADTLTKYNFIDITPPVGAFSTSDTIGCTLPYEIFFTDQSIGADSWLWEFGDGTSSTDQNPSHVYNNPGSYVVNLTVENAASGCEYKLDKVLDILPIETDFDADSKEGCYPMTINFQDLSLNAVSWLWDFGDGNTSTLADPQHVYTQPGKYSVKLKITNALGCADSLTVFDFVSVWGPEVSFDVTDSSDCVPFSIKFFNNTTSLAPVTNWLWDFGDGGSSTDFSPDHLYTQADRYTVSLIATDSLGCSSKDSIIDYILITDPIANFETLDTVNCTQNDIAFTDLSEGIGLRYLWEFGDGNTSNLQNPVHRYANIGTYAVKLTVTDINNCPADLVKVNYVVVNEPVVNFEADTTTADCPPLLVTFTTENFSIH